ncbi:activating transcription factor 7-interacting protein 1 isoform X1 [Paramormyrops kingsleyae]|uniref:activating transcription factor 7-interacting protein 1 isoform X1 n=1 Tax=Paramormyrops kingsleyae TaxID=1676925 RepID=UPI000CD5E928|nr:activating transcription factor 7-interacting protein 1-like isoform X1 [Paramormyrops kingsleyae]XP_023655604.1 activating transcription factor 7-interacting protein 1-like isoform X1 [Paramormyrops kingsleyae]
MEVAVAEEPQKKVFRARKTMKISDRQQLEFLHNSLPSSSTVTTSSTSHPSPPLVNGNHRGEDHPDSEKEGQSPTDSGQKTSHAAFPTSRSPSPLALSLSLSPSPPCHSSETKTQSPLTSTPPRSPKEEQHKEAAAVSENGKRVEKTEKGELKKEGEAATSLVNNKKNGHAKPDKPSKGPYVGLTDSTRKTREKQTAKDKKLSKKPMVTEPPLATDPLEDDKTTSLPLNTPSPSSSHTPEPDQEVKEGFLVLSEEDENQAERDETKEKEVTEEEQKVEKMEVDTETSGSGQSSAAPHVSTSSPTPLASGEDCNGVQVGLKRVLSKDTSTDGKLDVEERGGKRQKVDGEELEAQLELKISADAGRRLKLEKVVQQLVEEQLRVLQLTVFDRSLQELRERVEKMDCATKHQHTLNTLQAKIARLAKKFGAANQSKENVKKPEVSSTASTAPTAPTTSVSTSSATPVSRSPSRTTAESRQAAQNQPVNSVSSTACPNESKSPSTTSLQASSATVPAPVVSFVTTSTASSAAPSASNSATVTSQNQPGALMLKAAPASGIVPQSAPGSAPQAVPLQPLLIQLPLTVTNAQGGAMVANHSTGVELFPVTSLAAVSTSKSKTTTTFILQKSGPLSSVPPLTPIPSIAVARAVPPGGSGIVSTPASGVSVSSARTPTQAISVVGVTSSSFASSGPAATGGQSTGSAASGPTMASKTDNQPSSSSAKTPVQASRTNSSGAVIDLTEDDDDVQVTGVQKGPVPSGPAVSSSSSSSSSSFSFSQRPVGAPPPLISANNMHTSATGGLLRSSPQTGQHSVGGSQVAVLQRSLQARLGNTSSTAAPSPVSSSNPQPCPLPPLPSPPPLPARLPPEALHTSPPQQPQLKLARVQSQNGIVLSWCVAETDRSCAAVDSYHLYAYHQDGAALAGGLSPPSHWKKIGDVKALPLPMACTLTQFVSGSTYYFAVQARDVYGRFGPFCDPQCTDVIGSSSSN